MVGWSLSLGRIAGTEIRIHITFIILIGWFGITAGLKGGAPAALDAVAFTLAVFLCVLLHEYGHALTARRFGIVTRDIILLPIGGVSRIERTPEKPSQELLIAVAGPMVNIAIAVVLFAIFGATVEATYSASIDDENIDFVTHLALVNVMLAAFNLIPAFPMDGGRILRAVLASRLGKVRATRIAAKIGQVVAFGLGFLGLFGNPILLFIALFVFLAASHETYAVELAEATKGAPMSDATITAFDTIDANSTVGDAAEMLLTRNQREFPVIDSTGRLGGVLTRDGIIQGFTANGPGTPVVDVMLRDIATINRRAPLSEAVAKLQTSPLVCVVDDDGKIVGIVTLENIAEYLMVSHAGRHWRTSKQ